MSQAANNNGRIVISSHHRGSGTAARNAVGVLAAGALMTGTRLPAGDSKELPGAGSAPCATGTVAGWLCGAGVEAGFDEGIRTGGFLGCLSWRYWWQWFLGVGVA